jgi:4-amino-4-deoxy-L-arabinose transferase-like glycosyltransferase
MNGRSRRWLILTVILAFVLRVGFDVATMHRPLDGDELSYDQIAWNLASGHGFSTGDNESELAPTATRGPAYVLILTAFYRFAGHQKLPILLLQALLDTLSVWTVWRIGRRIFSHPLLALGGALIYAVYPPFIIQSGLVMTETLVNLLVLLGIDFGLGWALGGRRGDLPASGAAIGLAALSKPQLAPIAVLIVLAVRPQWRSRGFWLAAALQVAIVTAVLSPWIVRNAFVFHAFVPGVTMGGVTFWGGTGPADGQVIGGLGDSRVPAHVRAAISGMSERERDSWLYAEGMRVIRRSPPRFAGLMLKKFVRLWFNLLHDDAPSRASLMVAGFNLTGLSLGAWAAWRLGPPAAAVRLLVLLFVFFSIVHMLFFSVIRYALPCYAYIFSFAGAGAVALFRGGAMHRAESAGAPNAAVHHGGP